MENKENIIIGVDEVGRGCVAGPIVCASFAMGEGELMQICKDAKKMCFETEKERQKKLYERLTKLTYYDYKQINNEKLTVNNLEKNNQNSLINNIASKDQQEIKEKTIKNNLELLSLVFDSKKVSEKNRKIVTDYLLQFGGWGIGVVSNAVIDKKGIQYANKLAMLKSLSPHFSTKYHTPHTKYFVLTDHLDPRGIDYKIDAQYSLVTSDKMDSKSFVTAAASIIAKVYRDTLMEQYHKKYPEYGFINHVGYGTTTHMQNIKELGLCPIHRKSFLKNYI